MGIFDLFETDIERLKEKRDIRGLIKALRGKDCEIQCKASEALVEIGEPAIEPIIQVLKYENDRTRLQVGLRILEKLGKPAEEALIEASMDWVKKAKSLADLGKYEEAIKCYDKALDLGGENYLIWAMKGSCFFDQHKLNESVICYDKALKLNSGYAGAWYSKGIVLGSLGAHEDSIKCFDNATVINPQFIEALAAKATALVFLRKPEEAERVFDEALKINPNNKKTVEQRKITRLISAISKTMVCDRPDSVLFDSTNEGYIFTVSAHILKDYSPEDRSPIVKGPYDSKEMLYIFVKRRIAEILRAVFTSTEIKIKEVIIHCRHGVRHHIIGEPTGDAAATTIYCVSIDGSEAAKLDWSTISEEQIERMWTVRIDDIPTVEIQYRL